MIATVFAAALVRLPRTWTPLGDNALMRMWTDAVGTNATPLVGGDARFGWNHLGPWIFYLMAIPYRLVGSAAVGLLVGAAAINVVSLLITLRCVRGLAGERSAAVVAAGALLFLLTATGNRLIDPWNPYVVQMPFLLSLVACWAVINRQWRWLPWLVGAGSLSVQSHITFVVPVMVLVILATVTVVRSDSSLTKPAVRSAVIVAAIAWLPTLIDLFLPQRHNLYRVGRFFAQTSSAPTNGVHAGVAVVLRETGLRASWLGAHLGRRPFVDGFDGGLGLLPGVGVALLIVAAVVALRRRDTVLGSLVLILGLLLPAAVVEMALGQGELFPYLFGWVTLVGMMCWVAGILVVLQTFKAAAVKWTLATGAVALAICLLATGFTAGLPRSPRERGGDATLVRQLVVQTELRLSRETRYRLVHGSDAYSSIYELGVVGELRHDGYHIAVEPNAVVLFGRHMIDNRAASYPILKIVAPYESAGPNENVVALSDPLSPTERSHEALLVTTLATSYERDASPDAANIVRYFDGDLVLVAGFVHPDPQLEPLLRDLASSRKRGRSIAVIVEGTMPSIRHRSADGAFYRSFTDIGSRSCIASVRSDRSPERTRRAHCRYPNTSASVGRGKRSSSSQMRSL